MTLIKKDVFGFHTNYPYAKPEKGSLKENATLSDAPLITGCKSLTDKCPCC